VRSWIKSRSEHDVGDEMDNPCSITIMADSEIAQVICSKTVSESKFQGYYISYPCKVTLIGIL
jgi:hypothetical protein